MSGQRENKDGTRRGWWSVYVDLTGSRLGPVWRNVELVIDDDPLWPPHRIRHEAAKYYGVPAAQVGEPRWCREPEIPEPPTREELLGDG